MMLWFPLIHVAVGVGLSYHTLALFLNRETLIIANGALTCTVGPVPWLGSGCDLPTRDIQQLYVVEKRGNKGALSYRLHALVGGIARPITTGFAKLEVVRYLEQAIEDELRIVDRAVQGEVGS